MHPLSQRMIERSPDRLRPAVALAVRTLDAAGRDRLPGLAAELAFWVLLSLPALLLGAFAVTGLVIEGAEWQALLVERVVEVSRLALTQDTIDRAVRPFLNELLETGGLAVASFAFVATVLVLLVVVVIGVADVALPVLVVVLLIPVRGGHAVVGCVQHAVVVGVRERLTGVEATVVVFVHKPLGRVGAAVLIDIVEA